MTTTPTPTGRPKGSRNTPRTSPDGAITLPTGARMGRTLGLGPRKCSRYLSGASPMPVGVLMRLAKTEGWSNDTIVAVASEFSRRRKAWTDDR